MDAKQANERLDEVFLLDIREPYEWALGHIEAAVHVPMGQLAARRSELPTDSLIVCVCRSGSRSAMVTNALNNAGYKAENLEGGMLGWASRKLPIVTDEGESGRVG
jgi:rhodanese-related sulfurtransferase